MSLGFPKVSREIWSFCDLLSLRVLKDFFLLAVGEFKRAATTFLFVHVAPTRFSAVTLPRSIRNGSVATLSQDAGPGVCSRKELRGSLGKEKRFWVLHLVPFR